MYNYFMKQSFSLKKKTPYKKKIELCNIFFRYFSCVPKPPFHKQI